MNRQSPDINRMQSGGGVTIEQTKIPTSYANSGRDSADIRRDDSQPMDLGGDDHRMQAKERNCRRDSDNNGASNNANSSGEDEYGSDDDGDREKN